MTHNFWDHHPNLHKFLDFFCLLMKKIWGGGKKDIGPSSFQLLVTIIIFLLTWGLSSMQNLPVLFDSPSKESFQSKIGPKLTDLETIFELLAKEKTTLEILACWGIEIELNNFANNIWSSSLKISQIQIYPKCVENDICDNKVIPNVLKMTFVIPN